MCEILLGLSVLLTQNCDKILFLLVESVFFILNSILKLCLNFNYSAIFAQLLDIVIDWRAFINSCFRNMK